MALSPLIKDYVYSLNIFYDSLKGNVNVVSVAKFSLSYLFETFKVFIKYFFTCNWLADFYAYKITVPTLAQSILPEVPSLDDSNLSFLRFSEIPSLTFFEDKFFIGLLNGCFISIPVSTSQIIWLRRLVVNGFPSGFYAGAGQIMGQYALIFCLLFGIRPIVFPWFSLEYVQYISGIIISLCIAFNMAQSPLRRIKAYETPLLYRFSLIHFILVWTEQSGFFSYFANLSFAPESTIFEAFHANTLVQSLQFHIFYFIGICFGIFFWTSFFGWVVATGGPFVAQMFTVSYTRWVRGFNLFCLLFIISVSLTSLPYYNLDYIVTSPLGFVANDHSLNKVQLKTHFQDFQKGRIGDYSNYTSLDTDVSPFDRARYSTLTDLELTFEDLNYQGEYTWRSRNDRISGSSGKASRFMAKFFPETKKAITAFRQKHRPRSRREILEEEQRLLEEQQRILEEAKKAEMGSESEEESEFDENFDQDLDLDEWFIYDPLFNYDDFLERFFNDYHLEDESEVGLDCIPNPYGDRELFSAFQELSKYAFDNFSSLEELPSDEFEERLGKRIKSKYYSNLTYRSIINLDLLPFLFRVPKEYSLSNEEENQLFETRQILAEYYDTLRSYMKLPYFETFQYLFEGPKSYSSKVYNQQFKGTLKIVRRLFSITLDEEENPKNKAVLKFDEPLYKNRVLNNNRFLHQELGNIKNSKEQNKPFLKESYVFPFYAGWDDKLRKFVMVNYGLTRSQAGQVMNISDFVSSKKKSTNESEKMIQFTSWPVSNDLMEKLKQNPKINPNIKTAFTPFDEKGLENQRDIFEYPEDEESEIMFVYTTLPPAIKRVDVSDKEKIKAVFHPLRGGFAWPGYEPSKVDFRELAKELKFKRLIKLLRKRD